MIKSSLASYFHRFNKMNILSLKKRVLTICLFSTLILMTQIPLSSSIRHPRKHMYDNIVQEMSKKYNIPSGLIHSIILAESNYNSSAVSSKGAVGLMQLMPATAREYGVMNRYDPEQNIEGGVKYLKYLMKLFNSKTDLVLAAYNAGQEAIKKYRGIPPYKETINYVRKVKSNFGKPFIASGSTIYKFYGDSGKIIITNNPNFRVKNKKK